MPTRADIEAATPRCQARRKEVGQVRVSFGMRAGMTQQTVELTCLKPMRYETASNTWVCECGSTTTGELLGARATAFYLQARAA